MAENRCVVGVFAVCTEEHSCLKGLFGFRTRKTPCPQYVFSGGRVTVLVRGPSLELPNAKRPPPMAPPVRKGQLLVKYPQVHWPRLPLISRPGCQQGCLTVTSARLAA